MVALANPFTELERELWAPPEDLTTTQWADRYRLLSERVASQAGPYRSSRVPYAQGIMDALSDEEHREVFFMKPVQCGGSELGRNWLGRSCDLDPGPFLIVFPSQDSCKENMEERVAPMFEDTPRLRRLKTGKKYDIKKSVLHLRSCSIYTGWSGSPQALASRPIMRCLCDELDKWAPWRGVEADPLNLVRDRMLTYRHRRKLYGLSTPTTEHGPIARAIASCGDVRDYWVRCVECQELNLPDFKRVEWEGKATDVDEAELKRRKRHLEAGHTVATYSCEHCPAKLTQAQWWRGVQQGAWVSVGHEPGDHPASETVGFRLSGLCSPWIGIQVAAKEFTHAKLEGMGALQNFHNGVLGVPFFTEGTHSGGALNVTQQVVWTAASNGGQRGQVPEWTTGVVAGVDSGKIDHPYVVRAFGEGYRSQLLDYGVAQDGAELLQVLKRQYHGPGGALWPIIKACVDVGGSRHGTGASRTQELKELCARDPARMIPIKGAGGSHRATKPVITHPDLTVIDTLYWKDVTAGKIVTGEWLAFPGVSVDYVRQVASERRVMVEQRIKPDQSVVEVWAWRVHVAGLANHYWDTEVYATVAAHMENLGEGVAEVVYDFGPDDEDDESGWEPVEKFWRRGRW